MTAVTLTAALDPEDRRCRRGSAGHVAGDRRQPVAPSQRPAPDVAVEPQRRRSGVTGTGERATSVYRVHRRIRPARGRRRRTALRAGTRAARGRRAASRAPSAQPPADPAWRCASACRTAKPLGRHRQPGQARILSCRCPGRRGSPRVQAIAGRDPGGRRDTAGAPASPSSRAPSVPLNKHQRITETRRRVAGARVQVAPGAHEHEVAPGRQRPARTSPRTPGRRAVAPP